MRVADLFAGCGGFSAGFQSKQMDVVFAAENWEPACRNYEANFNHSVERLDLSNLFDAVIAVKRARPDIILGGPPCQEFSAAGLRRESKRAHLTILFSEIIRAVRPLWFVMENVPEAQSSTAWETGRSLLKEIGYGITEVNLNAAYYGVPQLRKRFFAIGRLYAEDHLLEDDLFNCAAARPLRADPERC